jgi:signal transduction histidine kinase
VWIGQEGRVTRVRDTLVTLRLAATEGVPDAPVRGLLAEADGTLWLATYGSGVARYEPTARVRVVPGGGAPAERMLSSIRLDRAGRFWLPGDAGLVIVARAALLEALATGTPPRDVARLGPAFGVPEANGGFPSSWVDSVGSRLWFATVDGAASVAMDAFPFDQAGPRIFVDEVRVDGRRVAVSDTLRVPSGAGAVELVLSTPQLGRVAGLRVRYRLDGADRAWVELGPGRLVRYAGLAPGRYHFAARVDRPGDPDGFAEQRLAVVVLPQWWETPWARVALAVSIVAGLSLLFRGLTRRMRARNAALQREIDERRRAEARAAAAASELAHVSRIATAGELATSIAHELNQPLAAVVSGAQAARRLAAAGRAADVGATLDAVVAQSNRAAEVIRSLRAFVSKHEVGHVEVAPDELVAEAVRLLGHELAGRGVTVAVEDRRQRRRRVRGNPVQLQQVLVNLLLNAGDAMSDLPAGERQVVVELCDGPPGMVRLSVRDRGRGMSAEVRERMFEPFFTTRPQGLGLGLSLGRSIVESHAGQLVAEASPQGGTVVHVVLPEVVA